MRQILELSVTSAVILRMVFAGLFPPVGRILSWPMYAWATAIVVAVQVSEDVEPEGGSWAAINPYEDLPRGEFMIGPDTLDDYLQFLADKHRWVRCSGSAYGHFGERSIEVADGHVVVAEPR
ncbi:hypothetical protein [Streptomyces beijiangensis]|uniref:Uncharacterized protein n=1 Tax=Streptomyces beijiangensis TaxID=163361 RepID=A0A939FDD5_9ACTN|nr:hypothetical protein [Streptomyces beijiangensis]MBO0517236.1 hypothetical protein [Streptomyces beijiangensis]